MRKSDGVCRVSAISVTKIVLEGDEIAAQALLLGKAKDNPNPMTFGNTVAKAGWPKEVTDLASQLREAMEDHFAQVLFEEEYDGNSYADGRSSIPAGLVQFGLGTPEDDVGQL